MADIKTMTEEITALSIDIEKAMMNGDYNEVVSVLKKIIEKLDEVVNKVNE
tara:strand:- start:297 stop:449 length:153 start_codon:yes stop_codon:yes gene_type:complete